uniref:methenyltetrahydrofolate cyclohydrolase n=2 Tax=environmental samples TaxID=651140 RepID=A0A075FT42_9ARCH|nr:methylenetetrahydrofolate dehydrogenase (folD) [uncultured marine thaumarchaeote AD1000_46_C12]AIE94527.1 methylenetetrahydrofolate dehydrogenase (folD) [uncultured marine thaumarchaeote AD1000_46_F05]
MIKENAIVIDVATTHYDGKLKGDSDFDEIISKASYASPVPGGVGPMTVAMLLKNTITAATLSKGIDI